MTKTFYEFFFPTIIVRKKLESSELDNKKLVSDIYSLRRGDSNRLERSNFKDLSGWHSRNDIHTIEDFKPLAKEVLKLAVEISEKLGYSPNREMRIGSMWSIVNPPGSLNSSHIHIHSLWSGVYYVQEPEYCGYIEFKDLRTEKVMNEAGFRPETQRPKPCWNKVQHDPEPGKLILFPSWLYHATLPNMSPLSGPASDRVVVNSNMNQE